VKHCPGTTPWIFWAAAANVALAVKGCRWLRNLLSKRDQDGHVSV
jgi:hypothetical protein